MNWQRLKRRLSGSYGSGEISATRTLIFVNLILFTLMVLHGTVLGLQMRAIMNPPTELLVNWGGQFWPLVWQHDQWWRCITYAFTHGGLIHLGFNMVVLYQVGSRLEFEIGQMPFLFLYVLGAITATVAGLLWHPMTPVVGASGSLFALIGFSAAYYHRIGTSMALQLRNFMIQWAVIAFLFGFVIGADNAGHLGGAVGGVVLGLVMPTTLPAQRRVQPLFRTLGIGSIVVILLSLAAMVVSWFLR